MNNFSDGDFANTKSSFFPKKSYNKIINMNLINSKEFMRHNMKTDINEKDDNQNNKINEFIKRSMKFYSKLIIKLIYYYIFLILDKDFDELLEENLLGKFDNVTFKTIKRQINKI
jgi:hypothetical protein